MVRNKHYHGEKSGSFFFIVQPPKLKTFLECTIDFRDEKVSDVFETKSNIANTLVKSLRCRWDNIDVGDGCWTRISSRNVLDFATSNRRHSNPKHRFASYIEKKQNLKNHHGKEFPFRYDIFLLSCIQRPPPAIRPIPAALVIAWFINLFIILFVLKPKQ